MLEQKFLVPTAARWSSLALLSCLWAMPQQADALTLQRCHVPGIAEEVRCGTFDVAENRDQPNGRQISLDIVVLPARSAQPKPDALFFMAGGPGQGATDNVAYGELFLHRVRETRDLVFVDQRGTGDSNPLPCELGDELAGFAEELPPDEVAKCRADLEQRADLTRYTTFHAMPDLDAVRAALGYEQINLWGGSYGTRAALVYQQLYPQHTRSLILDGMAPFSVTLPTYNAREAQRALDKIFADCAAEADCRQRFPDLQTRFEELLTRLEEPARIELDHPRTGHPIELVVTRETLLGTLRGVLYSAQRSNLIPLLIDRAYQGDLEPWIALGLQLIGGTGKSMSIGMTLSVLCSEDLPRVDSQELAAAVEGTYWGASDYQTWADACADWPRAELPANFAQPVASQVPALLLSGDLDPIVPPVWGEEVAKHLGNSLHLVVPGTGHNTSHVGCVPRLIASFVEQGSVEGLDASCIESVRRPPFVLDFFGANP